MSSKEVFTSPEKRLKELAREAKKLQLKTMLAEDKDTKLKFFRQRCAILKECERLQRMSGLYIRYGYEVR